MVESSVSWPLVKDINALTWEQREGSRWWHWERLPEGNEEFRGTRTWKVKSDMHSP